MRKWYGFQMVYLVIFIVVVFVLGVGSTYAYWSATTASTATSLMTESTIYSINMEISPLYSDFSFIPMNDVDAVKALRNGCKDKYGRGACSAYTINVFGYNNNLSHVSGYMDVTTNNMVNLSYMVYRISDTYDEDVCVDINDNYYCKVLDPAFMGDGVGLTLGDKYDVYGTESTEFILLIWLSNLDVSQNAFDIGSFNAVVTMQAGNGGEIKGVISSAVVPNEPSDGNEENNDNNSNDNTGVEDDENIMEG